MTAPLTDVAGALPPNNSLRIGKVTALTGGNATVEVSGKAVNCGFLDPDGLAVGGPVAILRGEASWLVLGGVDANYSQRAGRKLGANTSVAGTVVTTAATEVPVPSASWLTEPIYTFEPGRVFKVTITGGCFDSAGTVHEANIRVRKGQATIVGTSLSLLRYQMAAGIAANVPTFDHTGWFKNSTSAVVLSQLSLTLQRNLGAANVNLFGDNVTAIPLIVAVEDYGSIEENAAIAAVSASV